MDGTESVSAKKRVEAKEIPFTVVEKVPGQDTMPDIIISPGLGAQRQAYLFNEIRSFAAEDKQDIVAPRPTIMEPEESRSDDREDGTPAPAKKSK